MDDPAIRHLRRVGARAPGLDQSVRDRARPVSRDRPRRRSRRSRPTSWCCRASRTRSGRAIVTRCAAAVPHGARRARRTVATCSGGARARRRALDRLGRAALSRPSPQNRGFAPKPLRTGHSPRQTADSTVATVCRRLAGAQHIRNTDNIDNRTRRLGRPMRRPAWRAARPHGGTMSELDLVREELRELARTRDRRRRRSGGAVRALHRSCPSDPEAALARWRRAERVRRVLRQQRRAARRRSTGAYEPDVVLHVRARPPAPAAGRARRGSRWPSERGLKTLADIEAVWGQDARRGARAERARRGTSTGSGTP